MENQPKTEENITVAIRVRPLNQEELYQEPNCA